MQHNKNNNAAATNNNKATTKILQTTKQKKNTKNKVKTKIKSQTMYAQTTPPPSQPTIIKTEQKEKKPRRQQFLESSCGMWEFTRGYHYQNDDDHEVDKNIGKLEDDVIFEVGKAGGVDISPSWHSCENRMEMSNYVIMLLIIKKDKLSYTRKLLFRGKEVQIRGNIITLTFFFEISKPFFKKVWFRF